MISSISNLVSIILCKIKDQLPPFSGGVSGIKNLTDNTEQSDQIKLPVPLSIKRS